MKQLNRLVEYKYIASLVTIRLQGMLSYVRHLL
jgi:hypothetical protein